MFGITTLVRTYTERHVFTSMVKCVESFQISDTSKEENPYGKVQKMGEKKGWPTNRQGTIKNPKELCKTLDSETVYIQYLYKGKHRKEKGEKVPYKTTCL